MFVTESSMMNDWICPQEKKKKISSQNTFSSVSHKSGHATITTGVANEGGPIQSKLVAKEAGFHCQRGTKSLPPQPTAVSFLDVVVDTETEDDGGVLQDTSFAAPLMYAAESSEEIVVPADCDVLCTKCSLARKHPGNIFYSNLVKEYQNKLETMTTPTTAEKVSFRRQ
jgi:hypothetical protein